MNKKTSRKVRAREAVKLGAAFMVLLPVGAVVGGVRVLTAADEAYRRRRYYSSKREKGESQ